MHTVIGVLAVGTVAFIGTMIDNFFAFASQLALTEKIRFRRVSIAHAMAVGTLIILAVSLGGILTLIPLRLVGVLCVAPWALALHAWRDKDKPVREQFRRGALTTYTLCFVLGGDNIAVWVPLLRANGSFHEVLVILVFGVWESALIFGAQAIAGHDKVIAFGARFGRSIIPWVYVALGALILVECGTF